VKHCALTLAPATRSTSACVTPFLSNFSRLLRWLPRMMV
jgi:hypothetical protein